MIFKELEISGVYLITPEKKHDERGYFLRVYCEREFSQLGLCTSFVQENISYNQHRGTLRGMHYQIAPHEEIKLVSCMRGAIYDVVLDIRPNSPTYGKWLTETLTYDNNAMLYIPGGLAHGFQTLEDDTLVHYHMGEFYNPEASAGIRFDDSNFNITWPIEGKIMSEKDKNYSDFIML